MRSTSPSLRMFCRVTAIATLSISSVSVLSGQEAKSSAVAGQSSAVVERGTRKSVITLDAMTNEEAAVRSMLIGTKTLQKTPENFRQFGALSRGQVGDLQKLTLHFAAAAKLLTIKSTPDFEVEQGGSCVAGDSYAADAVCTLLVRSTPQGAGQRFGKLEIANSAEVKPLVVGLGGFGFAPTISFTPSIITTVPGTSVRNAGLLKGALNLAIDAGDTLYMADTGNNQVRYMDSSGVIKTASSGSVPALGVAVDMFGEIFFDVLSQNLLYEIFDYGSQIQLGGTGMDACTISSACSINSEFLNLPGEMAADPYGNIFMVERSLGAAVVTTQPYPPRFYRIYDPFAFQTTKPGTIGVDANDNLYTFWGLANNCRIVSQTLSNAANSTATYRSVAGGRSCGFAGDGGQAGAAQISSTLSQITFDVAGNMYFSDTGNQRVRRVDAGTGTITTIAGNGTSGSSGDGGPATGAALNAPTGVAVDSQGQVYIISSFAATGTTQVVRKVGVVGALNLGNVTVGAPSIAQTVTVANTGNSDLHYTHVGFSSGNTSEFTMDVNTTSCNFTVPLASGRSCKIGFIFKPTATGNRSAVLTMTDDTIAGVNTIQLSGAGYTTATLTPASMTFASTNVGSTSASQTATLKNTGAAVMTISSIAFAGSAPFSFLDTTNCGATLAVGASCTISLSFKPAAAGTRTNTLTVSDNALGGHQSISVTGVGVAVAKATLSPGSLTFASTPTGKTTATQTIKLSNTGSATLGVTSISRTGTNSGDYTETNNCGTSVAAGGSCNIVVAFKPTATGTRAASVSIMASTGQILAGLTGPATAAKAVTKTALTSTANSTAMHSALMLTAQVSGDAKPLRSGTVQIWEGKHLWATGELSDGAAKFALRGIPSGTHTLAALFVGDAKNAASQSSALRQVVAGVAISPILRAGPVTDR